MTTPRSLLVFAFLGALTFVPACSEDVSLGNGNQQNNLDKTNPADKDKVCAQVLTCVEGKMYPTACGPSNGDKAIGPCEEPAPTCNPDLICTQVLTCVEGQLYPTGCGPANCDKPLGPCGDPDPACDPEKICTQVLTCVEGQLYPTGCGPANCDKPLGPCDSCCKADEECQKQGLDRCVAGTCREKLGAGQCWNGSDCGAGQVCQGAAPCPCGLQCVANKPGKCK